MPFRGFGYFTTGMIAVVIALLAGADFNATSSFWLFILPAVNVNNIIIKTGTNKSRNGDTLVNFFIAV